MSPRDPRKDIEEGFQGQKGSPVGPCPARIPHLFISRITFHGNLVIDRDTEGDFPKPEWDAARPGDEQSPVCCVQGATIEITAEFEVLGAHEYKGPVTVRGKAELLNQVFEWTETIQIKKGDETAKTSRIACSRALPARVGVYDPMRLVWKVDVGDHQGVSAGESAHLLYTILAEPKAKLYWTPLDISCRWADGARDQASLLAQVFPAFRSRKLTRKRDGKGLTYWRPGVRFADMDRCRSVNTWGLLHFPHARGQCGSWSELMLDMLAIHGHTSGEKIGIYPETRLSAARAAVTGFLVKNWQYLTPPLTSPDQLTHVVFQSCLDQPGLPGQRNPDPPGFFANHFVVRIGTDIYDPSYGGGPFSTEELWESASLDGLMSSRFPAWLAGFSGSAARLTVFISVPRATDYRNDGPEST